ncbi:MAG TPA: tetratricopeptide repeat protein [Caulobacteraceae bacterium]|jgi:tetratricopeptide (TPR) repeat protein|nr:tetratricopeptide repeat protein [Caulobacteraceae bacterium]
MTGKRIAFVLAAAAALLCASSAQAGIFGKHDAKKPAGSDDAAVKQIQQAIDEQRYLDAGRMLDQVILAGGKDPRLTLLAGDLDLVHSRWGDALADFKRGETAPDGIGQAYQGEGIALSALGRSDEAVAMLQKAVAQDPSAWRAWDALGVEFDNQKQWTEAEAAYDHAMIDSGSSPIVLNNRGYSRLLQHRADEAVADFVAALKKKPDFAEARTNLRLAIAMKGDYTRATAGGEPSEQAALLNNAGFAAAMRGDYAQAEDLLDQAMRAKGEYYARAADNMKVVEGLKAQDKAAPNGAH